MAELSTPPDQNLFREKSRREDSSDRLLSDSEEVVACAMKRLTVERAAWYVAVPATVPGHGSVNCCSRLMRRPSRAVRRLAV
jgi:hypothetical protein